MTVVLFATPQTVLPVRPARQIGSELITPYKSDPQSQIINRRATGVSRRVWRRSRGMLPTASFANERERIATRDHDIPKSMVISADQ